MRIRFGCDPVLYDVLQPPLLARDVLPDWLRQMPGKAYSDTYGQDVRTIKHCPPFVDAMTHGFVMTLPCDVAMSAGKLSWNWRHPPISVEGHTSSPISFHVPAQLLGTPLHDPSHAALKFNSFWTIELEPGWSLMATHPINRLDLPFRTITGLVDSDRFHDVGIFFPALWVNFDFSGVLPRGTPIAQCFPVNRAVLDLDCRPFTVAEAERYATTGAAVRSEHGVYRKLFRAPKRSVSGEKVTEPLEIEDEETGTGLGQGLADDAKR